MRRILISLPEDEIDRIDQEAQELLVSRNTYINWLILGRDPKSLFNSHRAVRDKQQDKLSALKS